MMLVLWSGAGGDGNPGPAAHPTGARLVPRIEAGVQGAGTPLTDAAAGTAVAGSGARIALDAGPWAAHALVGSSGETLAHIQYAQGWSP